MSDETAQRRLILYMSMSLDGFAARRDGVIERLGDPELTGQRGKDMVVFGGASFARSLAAHGLIDEYRVNVQPVALGDGLPLLHGLAEPQRLKLVSSTTWADGPITQTYVTR